MLPHQEYELCYCVHVCCTLSMLLIDYKVTQSLIYFYPVAAVNRRVFQCFVDIFVQKNKIEMLNMTGAKLLVYLDASYNHLMNIHGLYGCRSLQHLDLSHNRITRVGKSYCCCCWLPLLYITSVCICDAFLARDVIYTSCAYATMSVSICL